MGKWLYYVNDSGGEMPTTITSNGSGKCPVHGGSGSLYKCKKCGDVRCWSCLQKIGGANKPCAICSK